MSPGPISNSQTYYSYTKPTFCPLRSDFGMSQSCGIMYTRWRHQMETFAALLAICAGNSPVPSEFRAQRPVTRSFDVFFDLRLNKPLSKQWWGWWFETLSRPLWRHCNDAHLTWGFRHLPLATPLATVHSRFFFSRHFYFSCSVPKKTECPQYLIVYSITQYSCVLFLMVSHAKYPQNC